MSETPVENPSQQPSSKPPANNRRMMFIVVALTILVLLFLLTASAFDNIRQSIRNQPTPTPIVTNPTPTEYPSMEERKVRPCDFNGDGQCDRTDFARFMQAFGKKRGELGYDPFADVNADGVITAIDAQLLQFPFSYTLPAETPTTTARDNQVMCTQEIKQCPDGSYVTRKGPNCEFAACP